MTVIYMQADLQEISGHQVKDTASAGCVLVATTGYRGQTCTGVSVMHTGASAIM